MRLRLVFFSSVFFLTSNYLKAQIERYKGDPADTATYIAPEDTITRAPMFGDSPDEIYRYIENRYNLAVYGQYLSYYPEQIRFSFYVERSGKISDFKILYASQLMIGTEIESIITTMPEWTPGKEMGKKKRTLMIYDVNIQITNDFPKVLVTPNGYQTQFSNRYKSLKWFLLSGAVLVMVTLLLTR